MEHPKLLIISPEDDSALRLKPSGLFAGGVAHQAELDIEHPPPSPFSRLLAHDTRLSASAADSAEYVSQVEYPSNSVKYLCKLDTVQVVDAQLPLLTLRRT